LNYTNYDISGPADYFLYQVKKDVARILTEVDSLTGTEWNIDEDGLIITTTLNLALQNYANNSFREHVRKTTAGVLGRLTAPAAVAAAAIPAGGNGQQDTEDPQNFIVPQDLPGPLENIFDIDHFKFPFFFKTFELFNTF
jgi:hypothetical protein